VRLGSRYSITSSLKILQCRGRVVSCHKTSLLISYDDKAQAAYSLPGTEYGLTQDITRLLDGLTDRQHGYCNTNDPTPQCAPHEVRCVISGVVEGSQGC
jgi:hypothetical protein